MSLRRHPLDQITPTTWSGGRTWEQLILPPSGTYAPDPSGLRHFDVRVSTASVETESSTFTPLPGVDRWLLVDEPVVLTVNDVERPLSPGEVLRFRGEDEVTAVGQTRDLNVMVRRDGPISADVRLTEGVVEGPAVVVEISSRDLLQLSAGESVELGPALVVRLS